MAHRTLRRAHTEAAGQSLVELALMLPVLLLLIVGIADVGRAFAHSASLASAAREAALTLARDPSRVACDPCAVTSAVTRAACNATGLAPHDDACQGLSVSATVTASAVTVTVTFEYRPLIAALAARALPLDPVRMRATSRFPVLSS